MISNQENLKYIEGQPDFRSFDDPEALLAAMGPAWINDPNMPAREEWTSAVKIVSFAKGMASQTGFVYGGIVPMIGATSDKFGLNSFRAFEHLQELFEARDGHGFRTVVMSYRDDVDEFSNQFFYADDRREIDATGFGIDQWEVARQLRPTRGVHLDVPVTVWGARSAATKFLIATGGMSPVLKKETFSADRLDGGWRLYVSGTPMQREDLGDIGDTVDGAVALVNDSAAAMVSLSNVDCHQQELDALPVHDTTWD